MYRIIETGRELPKRAAWEHDGVRYCRNELSTASPERLAEIGVEYIPDPPIEPVVETESQVSMRLLYQSDMLMPRSTEDLYRILIAKGVINRSELATQITEMLDNKELWRSKL